MPSQIILCKNCQSKKRQIEKNGALKVISCKPLPGEESKPQNEKRCKIKWTFN